MTMPRLDFSRPMKRSLPAFARAALSGLFLALLVPAGPALADLAAPASEQATAELLLAEIARQLPDAVVEKDAEGRGYQVTLGDGTSVLVQSGPLHQALVEAANDTAREEALHQYVRILIEDAATYAKQQELDLARVYPVIRPIAVLGAGDIPSMPFAEGLVVVWVQDSPSSVRALTSEEVEESSLDDAELQGRAMVNLATRREAIQVHREGKLNWITLDGFYESSMLLDQSFWQGEAQTIAPVAVIPGPGVLAWVNGDDPEALAILRDLGDQFYARDPMPISPLPLRWTPSGWVREPD